MDKALEMLQTIQRSTKLSFITVSSEKELEWISACLTSATWSVCQDLQSIATQSVVAATQIYDPVWKTDTVIPDQEHHVTGMRAESIEASHVVAFLAEVIHI
jgi:hypothetical protein